MAAAGAGLGRLRVPGPPAPRAPRVGGALSGLLAALAKLVLFPRTLWRLSAVPSRALPVRRGGGWKLLAAALHGVTWLGAGMPLTLIGTAELAITLNRWVVEDEYDGARLQSDFAAGLADGALVLPGADPGAREATSAARGLDHAALVERYSPVVVQRVSFHPEWDVPVRIDFDGNPDPRDNVANEPSHRPHRAAVHGEVTAETEDSFYLTYAFYHVRDYDHPVRERISRWTHHDSDNEGFHIRIDKETMEIVEAETWFHNRFLYYNRTGLSRGTEPVHGTIHTEGGTHPIVYSQALGHGVRMLQRVDLPTLERRVKILRLRRAGEEAVPMRADRELQLDCTYDLVGFESWYAAAAAGSEEGSGLFDDSIALGTREDGSPLRVGRFIATADADLNGWSRPKPMWSWDDGWDEIPIAYWHFFPSRSFASHGGADLSHDYLYNAPVEAIFGMTAAELYARTELAVEQRGGNKWDLSSHELRTQHYRAAMWVQIKQYVNYLWHALG